MWEVYFCSDFYVFGYFLLFLLYVGYEFNEK